jgi:hypothetical protein
MMKHEGGVIRAKGCGGMSAGSVTLEETNREETQSA